METADLLERLTQAPVRLAAAAEGVDDARLAQRPAPQEWSAAEVLAHLRSCGTVWGQAVATILREDRPTIRARNPRTWIRGTDYESTPYRPALQAFSAERAGLLALLRPLPAQAWERSATATGAGRPLLVTVRSYVERLAVHERSHLRQVERLLGG